ncbi:MAG: M23 family metallopeptidase [Euzebyales bacterium]|nr:M23 family metallopeptidase [Euzebyales bacterium]
MLEAQRQLTDAQGLAALLAAELDAAAGRFEHANAHRLRLEVDLDEGKERLVALRDAADDAHERFAAQVETAYKHPHMRLALAGANGNAPDARTALHRAGLLERLAVVQRDQADLAGAQAQAYAEAVTQVAVIGSGARGATADSKEMADALTSELAQARHAVEQADQAVGVAQTHAAERLAAQRREAEEAKARQRVAAAAAARAARLMAQPPPGAGGGPLPPVDGKVCPLGTPNGFIDSWGFPRSGGRRHQGVDMFAAHGTPIYAVADGRIARVFNNRLGGLSINLVDTAGNRYYYAHLSATHVTTGQQVRAGDHIGANGNTGNARTTPSHLHWQYHPGGGPPVNPFPLAAALCR